MRIARVFLRLLIGAFILVNIMAAFHAYKFTRFYDDPNLGKPRTNQMSSLEKAKVMLFGLNYPKSVNKEEPRIRFDSVTLHTEDSMHLAGWYMPNDSAKGTIVLFHGHGSCRSALLPEAGYMFGLGYNVLLIDFRAHGNSEGYISTIGYREARDVKAAYDHIRSKGEKNLVLWGVSLGAASIVRSVAAYDIKPEKIILELSFGSALEAVKGRARIMHIPEQPTAGLLAFWGSVIRGFWVFDHDPSAYAKKLHCPVMVAHAARDERVTRSESEAIYNNIPHQNKRLVIYEQSAHESLYKREPEKWMTEIKTFLSADGNLGTNR